MTSDMLPAGKKPKRTDLGEIEKRMAFEVQTDKLGVLKGGRLTVKVWIDIEPLLAANPKVSDEELVRALMRRIVKCQPAEGTVDGEHLSEEQAHMLSVNDIERFAVAFLENERVEQSDDDSIETVAPISALARYARNEHKKATDTLSSLATAFGKNFLSETTKSAFSKYTDTAKHLQSMFDSSSFKSLAKHPEFSSGPFVKHGGLYEAEQFKLPYFKTMEEISKENTQILVESLKTIAAATRDGNEVVIGLLADSRRHMEKLVKDSEDKAKKDASSQKAAIWWAFGGIAASVLVGGFGAWVAWKSYTHDLAMDVSEQQDKAEVQRLAEEQKFLLQESLAAQKEQNRILRDALAKANKAAK